MARPERPDAVIAAPFGRMGIRLRGGAIADIDFLPAATRLVPPRTEAVRAVCARLRAYFADPKAAFDIALAPDGTHFQRRVWRALRRIPPGKVLSYGELARSLKTGARAVGNACRANPILIVVPCHRVVAKNGAGGFMGRRAGKALRLKRWLLEHERGG